MPGYASLTKHLGETNMRSICGILFLMVPVVLSGCGESGDDSGEQVSWLYTGAADSATLGVEQITLDNPGDVFAFSDRPERINEWMSMEAFAAYWELSQDNFTDSPPNVVVEGIGADGSVCTVEVVLESPPNISEDSVSFDISYVTAFDPNCATVNDAALFIDSFWTSACEVAITAGAGAAIATACVVTAGAACAEAVAAYFEISLAAATAITAVSVGSITGIISKGAEAACN